MRALEFLPLKSNSKLVFELNKDSPSKKRPRSSAVGLRIGVTGMALPRFSGTTPPYSLRLFF